MKLDLHNDDYITFKADTHQYFDPDGNEYTCMSRVINSVKNFFDRDA
mgnify:CR=1 FL=1